MFYVSRFPQHASRSMHYISQLRNLILWLALALAVGSSYLAVSAWGFGFSGFPLDDAWIHQTYARNLARSGQLAYVPGVPSAGSTAPLWTLLLSLGYLLGLNIQGWTYGLGILLLGLTGWTVTRLAERLFPQTRQVGIWAGLFCVFEWHVAWAAVSGMETMLFVWLSLFLVEHYLAGGRLLTSGQRWPRDFRVGVLGGLLILTRPEGIGLVGLIGLDMAFFRWRRGESAQIKNLVISWLGVAAGVSIFLGPYLAFHWQTTGLLFPNTLYAKQAEYLSLQTYPLWWRLFGNIGPLEESVQGVFRVIFIGAQFLLLPGLVFAGWLTIKERRTELLLIWAWWASYLLLYGFRLPVTYQHGRYQIPTIVWLVLLGVWGTSRLISRSGESGVFRRVFGRSLGLSLVILVPAFTGVGAWAYGRDVRFIESEMVATAKWLGEQSGPDTLIAAHDIGAIGYFAERPLIDLAGLVTPEVIPFIRDEAVLFDFIIARRADYLVTFPSWYPEMTQDKRLIPHFTTGAPWSRQAGGDNMAVYQISNAAEP
jgi:hypothetical protein